MTRKFYIACGETPNLKWPVFYVSKESKLDSSTFKFGLLQPGTQAPYENDVLTFNTIDEAESVVDQLKQTKFADESVVIRPSIRQVLVQ